MAVAVTPDGQRALSASDDRSLRLWDLEDGAELAAFHADAAIQCCAVSQDKSVLSPAMPSAASTYWISSNSRISHRPVEGFGRLLQL